DGEIHELVRPLVFGEELHGHTGERGCGTDHLERNGDNRRWCPHRCLQPCRGRQPAGRRDRRRTPARISAATPARKARLPIASATVEATEGALESPLSPSARMRRAETRTPRTAMAVPTEMRMTLTHARGRGGAGATATVGGIVMNDSSAQWN